MLNKIKNRKKKERDIYTLSSPKKEEELFSIIVGFRIDEENYSKLKLISSDKLRFENLSHLIRCALIKFIKEEKNENKRFVN